MIQHLLALHILSIHLVKGGTRSFFAIAKKFHKYYPPCLFM